MKTVFKFIIGLILAISLFLFAFYRTPQERAFAKHLKEAQNNDSKAALTVAQDYLHGVGISQNIDQALEWFQRSYTLGNPQAAYELYQLYHLGEQVPLDTQAAIAFLQVSAQEGYPQAQHELARAYEQGDGVPQHAGQSLFWDLQAAQNGSTDAQTKVSSFAIEQPELFAQLTRFLQTWQAAQHDNPQAQLEVGQAYRYGTPILKDDEISLGWFKKAWDNSQHTLFQAAFELADQYYKGEGTGKNENSALELWAIAAEHQNPSAQYQLGELAYTAQPARLKDAFAWFSNAAAQGHAKAQYMTGFMLLQGQGTAPSVPLAIRFFEQAGQQNDASAQYVLGQIYTKGLGVKKDTEQGRSWLERSAENGNKLAKELLTQLEKAN